MIKYVCYCFSETYSRLFGKHIVETFRKHIVETLLTIASKRAINYNNTHKEIEDMSQLIAPSTLPGFMELTPKNQVIFNRIKEALEDTYRLYGFYPIDTPVLEKSEILLAKAGGETEKQIYRFNKGDTDITMRFDLTVPLAKYVAQHFNQLSFPFKRYQIGKVYRGERAQHGRFREFYQADIDIIGNNELNIINDAEIPSIIYTALKKIGIDEFVIRINNRKLLNGLFEIFELKKFATLILHSIDKIEKIGKDHVLEELKSITGKCDCIEQLLDLLCSSGNNEHILAILAEYSGKNEMFDAGLKELKDVLHYIAKFGVPDNYYRIDLTIARGLDYYTGTVYETTFTKHPEIGSICSGGRYDNLAEYYTKNKLPGVGMSIGLTRLFSILSERDYLDTTTSYPTDVMIIPMTEDVGNAIEVSAEFRKHDIGVQIFLEKKKFKNMITYANKLSIPFVIFLGEDEINSGLLTLKDMQSGNQNKLTLEDAISFVLAKINKRSQKCISLL